MEYDVYFDESGDLGWTLNHPYRKGGSSQYFTIAYIILPTDKNKYLSRFLKKFHRDRKGKSKEIKGASFRNARAKTTARNMVNLLKWNDDITIGAVTIKKSNIPNRVRETGNEDILYNHMIRIGLCETLSHLDKVNIIPDKRSVPSGSQNSCSDLLKGWLWLELNSNVEITYRPEESCNNDGLMFIDWIANFVWRNYEDKNVDAYHVLQSILKEQNLFF